MTIEITTDLADTLTTEQLAMLADARQGDARHTAHWTEASEGKRWALTGHARQIAADRILVWTTCDEAGAADVELVEGMDPVAAAREHAEDVASDLA